MKLAVVVFGLLAVAFLALRAWKKPPRLSAQEQQACVQSFRDLKKQLRSAHVRLLDVHETGDAAYFAGFKAAAAKIPALAEGQACAKRVCATEDGHNIEACAFLGRLYASSNDRDGLQATNERSKSLEAAQAKLASRVAGEIDARQSAGCAKGAGSDCFDVGDRLSGQQVGSKDAVFAAYRRALPWYDKACAANFYRGCLRLAELYGRLGDKAGQAEAYRRGCSVTRQPSEPLSVPCPAP
jgi:hypothetical protein